VRLLMFVFISLLLFSSLVVAADKVVFVVAAIPLGEADELIKAHLVKYGLLMDPHSQDEAQPVNISGASAVFVSESCSSGSIASAYKDTTIPVISTEFYIIDDMGFALNETLSNQDHRTIVITNPNDPIAGGLNGQIDVTTKATDLEEIQSCLGMKGDVKVVASLPNGNACLMYYEKGSKSTDGSIVPARRIFVFPHSKAIPLLTDAGWGLLERSVLWALGMPMSDVKPEASLATTWGSLKK